MYCDATTHPTCLLSFHMRHKVQCLPLWEKGAVLEELTCDSVPTMWQPEDRQLKFLTYQTFFGMSEGQVGWVGQVMRSIALIIQSREQPSHTQIFFFWFSSLHTLKHLLWPGDGDVVASRTEAMNTGLETKPKIETHLKWLQSLNLPALLCVPRTPFTLCNSHSGSLTHPSIQSGFLKNYVQLDLSI